MTRYERALRARLATNYEDVVRSYFTQAVEEWLQEGVEEVVRILTLWATREGGEPRIVMAQETLIEMIKIKNDPESLAGGSPCRWAVYSGPAGSEPVDLLSRSETRAEAHEDARRGSQSWINQRLHRKSSGSASYKTQEIPGQGGWQVFEAGRLVLIYAVVEEDP